MPKVTNIKDTLRRAGEEFISREANPELAVSILSGIPYVTLLVSEERDSKIAGVAGVQQASLLQKALWIGTRFIIVREEFQRQGLGDKLANELKAQAGKQGFNFILRQIQKENVRAIRQSRKHREVFYNEDSRYYYVVIYTSWKGRILFRVFRFAEVHPPPPWLRAILKSLLLALLQKGSN